MADEAPVIYLTVGEVVALHDAILRAAGQPPSPLRDRSLLESALQRPRHAAFYENADIITQAALYMAGIASNHPFVDGNKRAGYATGIAFLHLNGHTAAASQLNDIITGQWIEQMVTHALPLAGFIDLLRARLT